MRRILERTLRGVLGRTLRAGLVAVVFALAASVVFLVGPVSAQGNSLPDQGTSLAGILERELPAECEQLSEEQKFQECKRLLELQRDAITSCAALPDIYEVLECERIFRTRAPLSPDSCLGVVTQSVLAKCQELFSIQRPQPPEECRLPVDVEDLRQCRDYVRDYAYCLRLFSGTESESCSFLQETLLSDTQLKDTQLELQICKHQLQLLNQLQLPRPDLWPDIFGIHPILPLDQHLEFYPPVWCPSLGKPVLPLGSTP